MTGAPDFSNLCRRIERHFAVYDSIISEYDSHDCGVRVSFDESGQPKILFIAETESLITLGEQLRERWHKEKVAHQKTRDQLTEIRAELVSKEKVSAYAFVTV